jgi:hypothetical protein
MDVCVSRSDANRSINKYGTFANTDWWSCMHACMGMYGCLCGQIWCKQIHRQTHMAHLQAQTDGPICMHGHACMPMWVDLWCKQMHMAHLQAQIHDPACMHAMVRSR